MNEILELAPVEKDIDSLLRKSGDKGQRPHPLEG